MITPEEEIPVLKAQATGETGADRPVFSMTTNAEELERSRMEKFYTGQFQRDGISCTWARDHGGNYHSAFARLAWAAWKAARAWDVPASRGEDS